MRYTIPPRPDEDVRERIRASDHAVHLLRHTPPFEHVSRRLLADLMEQATLYDISPGQPTIKFDTFAVLIVLDGVVELSAQKAMPQVTQDFETVVLRPDVYLGGALEWSVFSQGNYEFSMNPVPNRTARVLLVKADEMGTWLRLSSTLRNSIGFGTGYKFLINDFFLSLNHPHPDWNVELVWVTRASHVDLPLEALTHLLAGAVVIGQNHVIEPKIFAAVVIAGQPVHLMFWLQGKLYSWLVTEQALDLMLIATGAQHRCYVFYVDPDSGNVPPANYKGVFHRIVYLTDALPAGIRPDLTELLQSNGQNTGEDRPFSTFIPTVFTRRRSTFADYVASVAARMLTYCRTVEDFRTREIRDERQLAATPGEARMENKLHRDLCPLNLRPDDVERLWDAWPGRNAGLDRLTDPFMNFFTPRQDRAHSSARRWARAVTNRRVGLAVSGGGACAYRIEPVLDELKGRDVPVDVLGGLSGGALIGAYSAVYPDDGCERARKQGPFFWLTLPVVMWSTDPLEAKVNWDLDGARVEELEVRFVAVTTKLPELTQPQASVVVRGTVGAAVRASGTLPPPFAPTIKNGVRYTDGAASTVIPSAVLRDYGADIVVAVSAIPGPDRTNPYSDWLIGRLLYNFTPFGRFVDGWAWNTFELQRTAAVCGDLADTFIEFAPETMPLLETIAFQNPQEIVNRARSRVNHREIASAIDEVEQKLRRLGNP